MKSIMQNENRGLGMKRDVSLYEMSDFMGYAEPEDIESYFDQYRLAAEKLAGTENWDTAIVYAILEYDVSSEALCSANFMNMAIPYRKYAELVSKLSGNCRLFFLRGRKEFVDE